MKFMGLDAHVLARLHKLGIVAAIAVFAAVLTIAMATGDAGAAPRIVVVGAATPAVPSCPTNCQAVGKTTGFQTSITGSKSPFVVPFRGRVVAWSIKTGAPSTKPLMAVAPMTWPGGVPTSVTASPVSAAPTPEPSPVDFDSDLIVIEEPSATKIVEVPRPAARVRRLEYRQLFAQLRRG